MKNKLEQLVGELKAANACEISMNEDYAKSMGYEDIYAALDGITTKNDLYILAEVRHNMIRLTSRHIAKLEKIIREDEENA